MDGTDRGLVRSIIGGCRAWETVDLLDDDIDYRTRTWRLRGCVLRCDVVYDRGEIDGLWRLGSVCLTFDERWVADYAYRGEGGPPAVRLTEMSTADNGQLVLKPLSGPACLPPYHANVLSTVDVYMVKLGLVSALLPIRAPWPGRPPRPPAR